MAHHLDKFPLGATVIAVSGKRYQGWDENDFYDVGSVATVIQVYLTKKLKVNGYIVNGDCCTWEMFGKHEFKIEDVL